jgi:hypothetical protein
MSAKRMAVAMTAVAMVTLYVYQTEWITDESRFKLAVKGRQEGFTFAATLRHVRKRLALRGTTVWISASERQSKEAIEYVKLHAAAIKEAFDYEEIEFPGTEDKALQVTFKHNGARIVAMPANPDTVRGFAGDVVLDEFAFHRDARRSGARRWRSRRAATRSKSSRRPTASRESIGTSAARRRESARLDGEDALDQRAVVGALDRHLHRRGRGLPDRRASSCARPPATKTPGCRSTAASSSPTRRTSSRSS